MTQAVTQGSTTTYAYDYAGNRVSQTVGSTTTIYPRIERRPLHMP